MHGGRDRLRYIKLMRASEVQIKHRTRVARGLPKATAAGRYC